MPASGRILHHAMRAQAITVRIFTNRDNCGSVARGTILAMTMRSLFAMVFLVVLAQQLSVAQQPQAAAAGDPAKGKELWLNTEHVECRECHGDKGQGGFGPDLAGRRLTRAQF